MDHIKCNSESILFLMRLKSFSHLLVRIPSLGQHSGETCLRLRSFALPEGSRDRAA